MKAYRYMSEKEFRAMLSGQKMTNRTDHGNKRRTSSKGFCFIGEKTKITDYIRGVNMYECEIGPEEALEYLEAIVTREVLVEFEAADGTLSKSTGRYAAPYGGPENHTEMAELCTETYDRKTLKPLRYKPFIGYVPGRDDRFADLELEDEWLDIAGT